MQMKVSAWIDFLVFHRNASKNTMNVQLITKKRTEQKKFIEIVQSEKVRWLQKHKKTKQIIRLYKWKI